MDIKEENGVSPDEQSSSQLEMREINNKLARIIELLEGITANTGLEESFEREKESPSSPTAVDILKMRPGTLKTFKVMQKLHQATCSEVAEETGRTHGLESRYLNELHRHGLLDKKREILEGRNFVIFSLPESK